MFYEFQTFISFNFFFFYFILIFYLRFDCFLFIDFQSAIPSEYVLNRSTFSHNFFFFFCRSALPIFLELMCIIVVNFGDKHNLWMFTMDRFKPCKCHLAGIVGLFENKCYIRVRFRRLLLFQKFFFFFRFVISFLVFYIISNFIQ